MKISLEYYFTKLNKDTLTYHSNTIDITNKKTSPDDILLKHLLQITPLIQNEIIMKFIIHSTSWRYDNNTITLSYLIYSDYFNPENLGDTTSMNISKLKMTKSESHIKPSPKSIKPYHVISHAMRHLAFLIHNGNYDHYDQNLTPQTIEKLRYIKEELSGGFENP